MEEKIHFQNQVKVDKYLLLAGADPKSVAGIFVYFKYGYFFSIFQQSTIWPWKIYSICWNKIVHTCEIEDIPIFNQI